MAEKPNQNSNKLSFKDFYTAEYKPGEDESINYRAYRRKRTEAYDNKGRGPTGVAYSKANPIHMKEIGKLVKSDKFKGNTSGLINHVKKNYPELHDHPAVQKAFQKHAETNEAYSLPVRIATAGAHKSTRHNDLALAKRIGTKAYADLQTKKKAVEKDPKKNWKLGGSGGDSRNPTGSMVGVRAGTEYTLDDILTILGERYVAKSIANKRKASIRMKVGKTKHKAAIGKRRASHRMATQDKLKERSRRQEWRNAFKKLAKGKSKKNMSIAQIRSIEKKLERPVWQRIVNRKSVIGVKDKRRLEIARKKGTWGKK